MSMGSREGGDQPPLWVMTSELARGEGHLFYRRLNELLGRHGFDRFVERLVEEKKIFAETLGRPSIPPGTYTRMVFVGYFEGLSSERAIAWKCADSLSLRAFLGYGLTQATPDHSTLSGLRRKFPEEVHREIFDWVLKVAQEEGLLKGRKVAIDATTLEANAAMRTIVRRADGASYQKYLKKLAKAEGIKDPTPDDLGRMDRKRKGKKASLLKPPTRSRVSPNDRFIHGLLALSLVCCAGFAAAADPETIPCGMQATSTFEHAALGKIAIYTGESRGTQALGFTSHMQVNADGAPDAYHPEDKGIEHICNGLSVGDPCRWKVDCWQDFEKAKAEGFLGPSHICFFGMAVDSKGRPIIQGPRDPKPGYYVSTTALQQPGVDAHTPQGQLDSNQIPFVVIPRAWSAKRFGGIQLGDLAVVFRKSSERFAYAVVGDLGPNKSLGEGSVALHKALGNDPFLVRQRKRRAIKAISTPDVFYLLFPGAYPAGAPLTAERIGEAGRSPSGAVRRRG